MDEPDLQEILLSPRELQRRPMMADVGTQERVEARGPEPPVVDAVTAELPIEAFVTNRARIVAREPGIGKGHDGAKSRPAKRWPTSGASSRPDPCQRFT